MSVRRLFITKGGTSDESLASVRILSNEMSLQLIFPNRDN